jgi:peptide/nickel transport system ATP-binding protein
VEQGATAELLSSPTSAETRKLIAAVPFGRPRGVPLSHAARMARPAGEEVPRSSPRQDPPALRAVGLEKRFRLPGGKSVTAVADVSFVLEPGRTLGLVGESGSGKSTTARLALALTPPDAGEVTLGTGAWSRLRESERRPLRALVGSVYQDALSSFDPRLTTSDILTDALWKPGRSRHGNRTREVHHLLSTVGLSPDVLTRRPLHLSGGQRQRVAIARALASEPQILILDEPVSALDVSVQATVLDLLDELQRELGLSYLFISHDLGVVQHMSDTVAVMHSGRIVETGPTPDVFGRPSHPYTRRLLAASPRLPW